MRRAALLAFALLGACNSRVDLDKGRLYPCNRANGSDDCTEGWHCGKEGYCHPRDAGVAWQCDTNDDCDDGWACGLEKQCHDTSVASAYLCEADTDCVVPWRCGLEGTCHSPTDVRDYQCLADSDCEGGWRCGLEGKCVDPTQDALSPGHFGNAVAESINPRGLSGGQADYVTMSASFTPIAETAYSYISGGKWTVAQRFSQGMDVKTPQARLYGAGVQVDAPSGVRSLVTDMRSAYALTDAGVVELKWSTMGPTVTPHAFPSFEAQHLEVTQDDPVDVDSPPLLIAYGGTSYALMNLATGTSTSAMQIGSGSPAALWDLDQLWYTPASLLAATNQGLYYAPREYPGFMLSDGGYSVLEPEWRPVSVTAPYPTSGGLDASEMFRVLEVRNNYLNGPEYVALLLARSDASGNIIGEERWVAPAQIYYSGLDLYPLETEGTCPACPSGETLEDFRLTNYASEEWGIETRCRQALTDGGVQQNSYLVFTPWQDDHYICRSHRPRQTATGSRQIRSSWATPNQVVSTDGYGRLGFRDANASAWISPLLSMGPAFLSGKGERLMAFTHPGTGYAPFTVAPDFGLTHATGDTRFNNVFAPVEGRGGWLFAQTPSQQLAVLDPWPKSGPKEMATMSSIGDLAVGPFQAAVTGLPDGGAQVIVTALDAVLSADITSVEHSDAGTPAIPLEVKAVPLSRASITSLAVLPPSTEAGAPLVSGFVLVQGRVFRFSALNSVQWRTQEIDIPIGEPIQVFADGTRGRIGYRDGSVFTLGSRVRIASSLPEESPSVTAFAVVCGQIFAAGSTGVFRLEPQMGEAVGAWMRETRLDSVLPGHMEGTSFAGSKLHVDGTELYISTQQGNVAVLKADACAP